MLEIKKRGIDIDPAVLRKQLKLDGPNSATIVLSRGEGVPSSRSSRGSEWIPASWAAIH